MFGNSGIEAQLFHAVLTILASWALCRYLLRSYHVLLDNLWRLVLIPPSKPTQEFLFKWAKNSVWKYLVDACLAFFIGLTIYVVGTVALIIVFRWAAFHTATALSQRWNWSMDFLAIISLDCVHCVLPISILVASLFAIQDIIVKTAVPRYRDIKKFRRQKKHLFEQHIDKTGQVAPDM